MPAGAALGEGRALNGDEITAFLPKIIALGVDEDTLQSFDPSGLTTYVSNGRPSTGKWWATATQYCSSWPPSESRACYTVLLDESVEPARLTWIGQSGKPIHNTIAPKD